MTRPRVLMVTGAYYPETSGAGVQCRQLVRALREHADFVVLTTTTDPGLPAHDEVDGVEVARVYVDPNSAASKAFAALRMSSALAGLRSRFDIVHLHGFSQKNMLVVTLARAFGKRVVLKLTSFGHDDAQSMQERGGLAFRCYGSADAFVGVGPRFEEAHQAAGLAPARFRTIPNGVDLHRFRPAAAAERRASRVDLGLPADDPLVLFVGFFSHEKRPDLLYRAWAHLAETRVRSTLVLVGASRSTYYEIDPEMADRIRADAAARGLSATVVFVESTTEIEKYYRAADVFALPTLREGLPNVLLEAMASGVPPVITRLPGVTDWIVDDGRTGLLVPPNDERACGDALARLLADEGLRDAMGAAARARVAERFGSDRTAESMLDLYRELMTCAA